MTIYRNTDEAWRELVRLIINDGERVSSVQDPLSIGSQFGQRRRSTHEVIATSIAIWNPRDRLILSKVRPFRLDFAIAQVIWALSGRDELEPLTFYHHRGSEFSDDGRTVRSAIGRRVFSTQNGNQFRAAVNKIHSDHSTRRAMIQIYLPEDLFVPSRDVSCTASLHLLARGSQLHAVGQMRSQSALVVLPYDLFLLTMLHEYASVCTGLQLGTYWHLCNSAHIYEDEMEYAKQLLGESSLTVGAMPPMPVSTQTEIEDLVAAERTVRAALSENRQADESVRSLALSTYWQDLMGTMVCDWKLRHGYSLRSAEFEGLPILYQRALAVGQKVDLLLEVES